MSRVRPAPMAQTHSHALAAEEGEGYALPTTWQRKFLPNATMGVGALLFPIAGLPLRCTASSRPTTTVHRPRSARWYSRFALLAKVRWQRAQANI